MVTASSTLPWTDTSHKPAATLHLSSSPTQLCPALLHMEPRCFPHGGGGVCVWINAHGLNRARATAQMATTQNTLGGRGAWATAGARQRPPPSALARRAAPVLLARPQPAMAAPSASGRPDGGASGPHWLAQQEAGFAGQRGAAVSEIKITLGAGGWLGSGLEGWLETRSRRLVYLWYFVGSYWVCCWAVLPGADRPPHQPHCWLLA